jgi:hypothetical protein
MPITNLHPYAAEPFLAQPEVGMGFQVGRRQDTQEFVLIIDSQVVATVDGLTLEQVQGLRQRDWTNPSSTRGQQENDFSNWLSSLPDAPLLLISPASVTQHFERTRQDPPEGLPARVKAPPPCVAEGQSRSRCAPYFACSWIPFQSNFLASPIASSSLMPL